MNGYYMVETHGNPLGTVHKILETIWDQAKLDLFLVPANDSEANAQSPRVLQSPHHLTSVNPFKPLMSSNTSRFIPQMLSAHPGKRIAALLRPCEIRSLIAMEKKFGLPADGLITISVDCMGTYPSDEYQWRAERKGSSESLAQESLQFAKQGGIVPYRFRSACQVCKSPAAQSAAINIAVIGLPVRQYILLNFSDQNAYSFIKSTQITLLTADQHLIDQHYLMVSKVNERNSRVSERIAQGLADIFPHDLEELVEQFNECGECQKCMSVCPICAMHMPIRLESGEYSLEEMANWVESCAGCGMCEQVCPRHRPLSMVFSYLKEQLSNPFQFLDIHQKSEYLH
jgi:formate dehydrogenase subunit beta